MSVPGEARLDEALRWALGAATDPALASADWLANDIDSSYDTAIALLTDPDVPLAVLVKAKHAFKTMRVVGETARDRRLAARLYLATIAAALGRHGRRISRQSDAALLRGLNRLMEDHATPAPLRHLAGLGLAAMRNPASPPHPVEGKGVA
jgi:hypothetical protein